MRNTIKVERARHNMTQGALAEKIKVSRQTINAIETGKYIPSTVLALRMSQLFGITVNELFELEEQDAGEV
jgi:putative transcriptional regulator